MDISYKFVFQNIEVYRNTFSKIGSYSNANGNCHVEFFIVLDK